MADEQKKLHIVMFPWLAFGHMVPFYELSKLIAKKGHKISFVSTPRNIDRLPKLPPNLVPLIDLVKLPLPHVDNLPEKAEATGDVPYHKVKYLKLAYDGLQQPLAEFLEESSPDWVLYDFVSYWLPPIASKFNISKCYFSIFIAAFLGSVGPVEVLKGIAEERTKPEEFTVPPKWVPFKTTVAYKLYEILPIFDFVSGEEDNLSDTFRAGLGIEGCDVLAIRSCSEFESEWIKVVEDIHHKPVFPVGQLPTTVYDSADQDKDNSWRTMNDWLDQQNKGSVVYVAFGSEAKPSQAALNEIALGLELSGLPFLWVLRIKRGEEDTDIIELPKGFEDRTKGSGIVWNSWAPQMKILSHESVGGFLTHSGWSSVVEAIQFEKALILLTFLADQGLNARVLEEKKMGYSIPRNERDGTFTKESVAESLRFVMIEEEGKIYKDKIKEMKGLFCDEARQDCYVENLLVHLQATRDSDKKTS